jgi:hypothetical protein
MKRKGSERGLFTKPLVPEDKDKDVSLAVEQQLDALRKGHGRSFSCPLNSLLISRLLAWSSPGTIVFAPPLADSLSPSNSLGNIYGSGPRLYTTVPSLDASTKRSYLLDPSPLSLPSGMENAPLDHILFNEAGSFLAVVDKLGTITIWEQDNTATQLVYRQSLPADRNMEENTQGSPNRVVSLRWLHNDSKVHIAVKLTKNGDQWACQSNSQRGCGPCNNVGKEAFIAVTADGKVEFTFISGH